MGDFAVTTYHCDGDDRRIGENERNFVKLAPSAPVLCQRHPASDSRIRLVHHPAPDRSQEPSQSSPPYIDRVNDETRERTILHHWLRSVSHTLLVASCSWQGKTWIGMDIPITQTMRHDHGGRMLLQRRHNERSTHRHGVSFECLIRVRLRIDKRRSSSERERETNRGRHGWLRVSERTVRDC